MTLIIVALSLSFGLGLWLGATIHCTNPSNEAAERAVQVRARFVVVRHSLYDEIA